MFEQLEARHLLAGNVLASVVGGDLFVTGDRFGNGVVISQVAANSYRLKGIDWAGAATTVNGRSEVVLSGLRANFVVDLGAGDDALAITNRALTSSILAAPLPSLFQNVPAVVVSGSLSVSSGAGNDVVVLGSVNVGRDALLGGGADSDQILVAHSTIGNHLRASGDAGDDVLTVARSLVGNTLSLADSGGQNQFTVSNVVAAFTELNTGVNDDVVAISDLTSSLLQVNTSSGNDQVTLTRVVVNDLAVDTAGGNDRLQVFETAVAANARLSTGDGADSVEMRALSTGGGNQVGGNLTLDVGAGNDTVRVTALQVGQSFNLSGGQGNDQAQLSDIRARTANLDMGDDADSLVLNAVAVDQLFARLGRGDDFLSVVNSRANRAVLDGGSGLRDRLDDRGNTFGQRSVLDFESFTRTRRF